MSKLKLIDQFVMRQLAGMKIVGDEGSAQSFAVPVIFGTDDKAAVCFLGRNTWPMKLPAMNLYLTQYVPTYLSPVDCSITAKYTLNCYSMFMEDMNQIVEQLMTKFLYGEPLSLQSVAFQNIEEEATPRMRVIKYSVSLEMIADFMHLDELNGQHDK